jgi:DNA primase
VEAFQKVVAEAPDIFEWEFETSKKEMDWEKPASQAQAAHLIGELWQAVPDQVMKESILQRMFPLFNLPRLQLRQEFEKRGDQSFLPANRRTPGKKGSGIEETLLAYCLLSESTAAYVLGHVEKDWLEEGFFKDWLVEVFRKMEEESWEAACVIPDGPEAEERQRIKARLLTMTLPQGKEALIHLKQCVLRLCLRHLGGKIGEKQQEFRQSTDPDQKKRIQAEIHELEKKEDEIRKSLTSS